MVQSATRVSTRLGGEVELGMPSSREICFGMLVVTGRGVKPSEGISGEAPHASVVTDGLVSEGQCRVKRNWVRQTWKAERRPVEGTVDRVTLWVRAICEDCIWLWTVVMKLCVQGRGRTG